MRARASWLAVAASCATAVPAFAAGASAATATTAPAAPIFVSSPLRDFGAGVVLGLPTGVSAKLWLDRSQALDFGAGYSGNAAFWSDWLWHFRGLIAQPPQGELLPYAGAGPWLEVGDPEFGIRTLMGLSYRLASPPIEIFAEAGPVFRLTQGGHVDAQGGVGARFYFADLKPSSASAH